MAFGLGHLRLAPRDFWSMTPRELAAAMSNFTAGQGGPDRADLARLMDQFPDNKEHADG